MKGTLERPQKDVADAATVGTSSRATGRAPGATVGDGNRSSSASQTDSGSATETIDTAPQQDYDRGESDHDKKTPPQSHQPAADVEVVGAVENDDGTKGGKRVPSRLENTPEFEAMVRQAERRAMKARKFSHTDAHKQRPAVKKEAHKNYSNSVQNPNHARGEHGGHANARRRQIILPGQEVERLGAVPFETCVIRKHKISGEVVVIPRRPNARRERHFKWILMLANLRESEMPHGRLADALGSLEGCEEVLKPLDDLNRAQGFYIAQARFINRWYASGAESTIRNWKDFDSRVNTELIREG